MDPKQCKSNDRLKSLKCQGIPNHKGPHWGYDAGGTLIRWKNKTDKDPRWKNIGAEWVPPGHASYISPVDMQKHHYLNIWAKAERKRRREQKRNAKARKAGK